MRQCRDLQDQPFPCIVQLLNSSTPSEHEYSVLESLYLHGKKTRSMRQRDLSYIVGISLGSTNLIVKRLVQRGWLAVKKINNRNIQYIVTPSGMEAITRRSYGLLKTTVRNVVSYKDHLDEYLRGVKSEGYSGIVLIGKSDLDFILLHLCEKLKLGFEKAELPPRRHPSLLVFSEEYLYSAKKKGGGGRQTGVLLSDILMGL